MVAYVIVPGIGGSGEEHWQTLWERRWGHDAARVVPRSWDEPDLDDWVDAVDRRVTDLARRSDEVVVVAHSLGCWAAVEWDARVDRERQLAPAERERQVARTGHERQVAPAGHERQVAPAGHERQVARAQRVRRAPVAGMLLVAPPDSDGGAFPRAAAASFIGLAVRPLTCRSAVVASSDDPYCSIQVARGFASGWGSTFRNAGHLGHLNAASGLGEWEWGNAVLGELIRA